MPNFDFNTYRYFGVLDNTGNVLLLNGVRVSVVPEPGLPMIALVALLPLAGFALRRRRA